MPILYGSGVEAGFDYLAISLLGSSLDSLYRKSGKNIMDLRSVVCIAMQLVSISVYLHALNTLTSAIQDIQAGVHA